eukprot:2273226-Amphidinium_carterae.1
MKENRRDRHYLRTTTTIGGKERKEEKEKETRTSFASTVQNQFTQATDVGGNRKNNYSISTNHNQCGHYQTTTQHRIYNLLLRQRLR